MNLFWDEDDLKEFFWLFDGCETDYEIIPITKTIYQIDYEEIDANGWIRPTELRDVIVYHFTLAENLEIYMRG